MAKGDDRAVVGASGKPLPGMILESGTKTIAKKLGCYDRPSGPHGQDTMKSGGAHFNVSDMEDRSLSSAVEPDKV